MIGDAASTWTALRPKLRSAASNAAFVAQARALAAASKDGDAEDAIDEVRAAFIDGTQSCKRADRQALLAAGLVLSDLTVQRWHVRVRRGAVEVRPPTEVSDDRAAEKARVRRQELVKRDAQLRQPSVQKFLRSMERTRVFGGKFCSIFSLMRDGRELAEGLRKAREHGNNGWANILATVVDPYLEFVTSEEATCSFTGLRLMDIWRYFRHTWSNQYTSVPGRTMMFLVRDRAAPFHPVVGIGALSSPVMQIRERDTWIGWHPETFLARAKENPTDELARWLVSTVDAAIQGIYVDDLLQARVIGARDLRQPSEAAIEKLIADSAEQRRLHHRYVRARDHKGLKNSGPERWLALAETHLFRSKRAFSLATFLQARAIVKDAFGNRPSAKKLAALASTGQGSDAIRKILKKAKADRVGIAVADITVCGAVQPYNAILGGKLVAMLAASPEVVLEYRRRYASAESEIASAISARAIVKTPALVLLGTTSLYGVGSSQYNRVKIPADRAGGTVGEEIRYRELGHSEAFGTSQYAQDTLKAIADLVGQSEGGQRVNSIFGEGVSPKLRKVRQGLDLLDLPSAILLRHYRRRIVYGVSLVRNLREYLLGMDPRPSYLFAMEDGAATTASIAAWWRERWLHHRICSDEVLAEVGRHTLVRPISHGARVVVPPPADQQLLFPDML